MAEPIKFEQANQLVSRPLEMSKEECGELYIFSDGQYCISLWQMSWKERLSALFFGRVWLWVYSGHTQPPVALEATKTIFEDLRDAI